MPKRADFTETENDQLIALIDYQLKNKEKSAKWLSEQTAYSESTISKFRTGKIKLSLFSLKKIAKALDKPLNYFLDSADIKYIKFLESVLTETFEKGVGVENIKDVQTLTDLAVRFGILKESHEKEIAETLVAPDFWKKPTILPFRSQNCVDFWEFGGDEILIRGPARCGKSTAIIEYAIMKMFANKGMQVLFARAYSVDLDAVRQNIRDIVKYRFEDPLSPIEVIGGRAFTSLKINEGELHLKGIDRSESQLGAGYDMVVFSQAEQIKKENIDVISSRCTPASNKWVENGEARSQIIYDANPNRLDHWLEERIKNKTNPLKNIDFRFEDHPAYFDEEGNETELHKKVISRLSRLEGVWRKRLLEGKSANPEGTIFEINDCHLIDRLPKDFTANHLIYRSMDFGNKDPSVCLWFGVHRHTGDIIVFREWRKTHTDIITMGNEVNQHSHERVIGTVIEQDEGNQTILGRDCGIPCDQARKGPGSVATGISLLQHKLQLSREGKDGGIYFYNNPVVRDRVLVKENEPLTVLDEFELYSWQDNADKPIDRHNHGIDTIRYFLDYREQEVSALGFGGAAVKRKTIL